MGPYWIPAPVWDSRTVAVLASGPSMSAAVAASVAHLPRITVNSTYRLAPDADVIYAADSLWWVDHLDALDCPGIKSTVEQRPGRRSNAPDAVRHLRNGGTTGYDERPGYLRTGENSGYQAVGLAVQMGAARVLLFGFDMHGTNGAHHWHGDHTGRCGNPKPFGYRSWIKHFNELAPVLAARGVEVVNCTPGSALTCFPFVEHQAAA